MIKVKRTLVYEFEILGHDPRSEKVAAGQIKLAGLDEVDVGHELELVQTTVLKFETEVDIDGPDYIDPYGDDPHSTA